MSVWSWTYKADMFVSTWTTMPTFYTAGSRIKVILVTVDSGKQPPTQCPDDQEKWLEDPAGGMWKTRISRNVWCFCSKEKLFNPSSYVETWLRISAFILTSSWWKLEGFACCKLSLHWIVYQNPAPQSAWEIQEFMRLSVQISFVVIFKVSGVLWCQHPCQCSMGNWQDVGIVSVLANCQALHDS